MANVPYLVPGDVWNLFLTLLEGSQVPRVQGNGEERALKGCLDSYGKYTVRVINS